MSEDGCRWPVTGGPWPVRKVNHEWTLMDTNGAERKRLAKGIPPDPAFALLFSYRQLDPDR